MKDWVAHYRDVKRRLGMLPQPRVALPAPATMPVEQPTEVGSQLELFAPPKKQITPAPNTRNARHLIQPILLKYGMSWEEISGTSRKACYRDPRREIYHVLREAGWSLGAIGSFMKRDHTTVIYGLSEYRKGELEHAE